MTIPFYIFARMTNLKVKIFVLLILFNILSGCKKPKLEDYKGDPGPAGTNAVQYNQIIDVATTKWNDNGLKQWEALIFIDKINSNVVNSGAVNVYIYQKNAWQAMPYLEGEAYFLYGYENGLVRLFYGDSHGTIPDNKPADTKIKVVVIQ